MEIKWEEPPSAGVHTRGKYAEIAEALRGSPGRWAIVAESSSTSLAANIKRGLTKGFTPAGAFEARFHGTGVNRGTVYARYVGGDDQ